MIYNFNYMFFEYDNCLFLNCFVFIIEVELKVEILINKKL